ncbi:MAG: ABC transporter permease [Chloroflexi bacterium]|nr:ABC transporter permease [Chloroflexota bacterium]
MSAARGGASPGPSAAGQQVALPTAHRGPWSEAWRRLLSNRLAVAGMATVAFLVLVAVLANLVGRSNPTFQDYSAIQERPSARHWLGTDELGRDAFSRLVHGARVSLAVGMFTQLIALSIGLPVGAIAGFAGGRTDNALMRLVDIVYGFPDLLFIILLRAVFGGSVFMIFLAIGLVVWSNIARLIRGQILTLKEQEFITAARATGGTGTHIVLRHLIPNSLGPVTVAVSFGIPRAIFTEAALSYIGIGVNPPTPTWGSMIRDGYSLIFSSPHLVAIPAVAIAVTMLAFTFLGDGLRDALDPHTRGASRLGTGR